MELRIKLPVPRLDPGAVSNLVGLAGVVAIVVAIGGLTGSIWWSVLVGGVAAVALAAIAQSQAEADTDRRPAGVSRPSPMPTPQTRRAHSVA